METYRCEKIWLWRQRTSVRTSIRSFPYPLESLVPYCFKLGRYLVDFIQGPSIWLLRGLWDFSKISCRLISRRKACKEIPGKNNILHWKKKISLLKYNAEKILQRCMSGKKFLTHQMFGKKVILQPQIQLINSLVVGEETELVNDIHQQNGWSALSSIYISTWWFATDGMRKRRTN